jgi:hypothetical protein
MASNIAVKVTADIVDLQTKFAVARAESSQLTAELNKLARQAADAGDNASSELKGKLTQAAEAAYGAQVKTSGLRKELSQFNAEIGHGGASTAAREFRALFDELSSGRTRQTPGTLAIIGQRVLGLGPAALAATGGVAALAAGFAYLAVEATRARDATTGAVGAAALANNRVDQSGIEAALKRLSGFPGITKDVATQVVTELAGMRGMTNAFMLSIADNIQAVAVRAKTDLPGAAKALREFIEAPAQNGGKFVDMLGATSEQSRRFAEAAKQGNAAALSVGLDVMANRMAVLDRATGATAKRMDETQKAFTSLAGNPLFGGAASFAGPVERGAKAAQKLQSAVSGNRKSDLAAALKDVSAAAATLPPSLEQIRVGMEKIGEDSSKTKEQVIKDQIAFLQGEQAKARQASSSAEAQLGIENLVGQKRVELATITRSAIVKETEKEKQERFNAVKQEVDVTLAGSNERIEALQREVNLAIELWGKESTQATGAARELSNARAQFTKAWVQQLAQASDDQIARDNETSRESIANSRAMYQAKEITLQQSLAQEEEAENTRYQQVANGLADKLALEAEYPELVRQVQREIEGNEVQHQKTLADIVREGTVAAAREYAESWASINRQVLSAESQFTQGLLSGRQGLMQSLVTLAARAAEEEVAADLRYWTERALLAAEKLPEEAAKEEGGVLIHAMAEAKKTAATATGTEARTAATAAESQSLLGLIGTQLLEWLGLESAKTAETTAGASTRAAATGVEAGTAIAASKATALAEIPALTGVAAIGAASAVAPIPIIGPALATAAFGQMQALGATALAVSSAAGGKWNVGADGDLYELHREEMVMPAYLARPMRAAVSAMANNGSAGATSGGYMPEIHNHFHPGSNADSIRQVLPIVKRHVAIAVVDALRENPSLKGAFR